MQWELCTWSLLRRGLCYGDTMRGRSGVCVADIVVVGGLQLCLCVCVSVCLCVCGHVTFEPVLAFLTTAVTMLCDVCLVSAVCVRVCVAYHVCLCVCVCD